MDTTDFIYMPGIGLPNDITSDSAGVIYVTDYWGDALYTIVGGVPSILIDEGLYFPNGILYDAANHRLLTLAPGLSGCPVMEISLADTTITPLVNTWLGGYDGIVADDQGRIYISEWTNDAIHRYDEPFSPPHTIFSSGHTDPADIYYDSVHGLICVPNFSTHSIDFVGVDPAGLDENEAPVPSSEITLLQCYPDPCSSAATLRYQLATPGEVRITLCDPQGRRVGEALQVWSGSGAQQQRLDLSALATGVYHYLIESNGQGRSGSLVVVR